jgi:16S rRNA (guanine1207-N2)-methyltransferase
MSHEALRALLLPFDEGLLPTPGTGRGFLMRAEASSLLRGDWRDSLVCEQTLKPEFDRLLAAGCKVVQRLNGLYDVGLCLLTKHKSENLANIARAWTLLAPGGVLACAGEKNIGAGSIENLMREALGVSGALSKFHCRVFWVFKPAVAGLSAPPAWLELDCLRPNVEGTYLTRPGVFGWDKVDVGSHLLVENFPETICGTVADFGAGWGYLSIQLLQRFQTIQNIDLYETELLALEAARANLIASKLEQRASFYWQDVAAGLHNGRSYDWVVMNPPFHSARATDVDLGKAFITAASKALRPGGCLVMVANRQLPYERQLLQAFTSISTLVEAQGFKVLLANQPLAA